MSDPIISAAHRLIEEAFDVLRRSVSDLSTEALDWEPAGPETNSITVLTTHSLSATRLLLHLAVGLPEPDRDRDAEFVAAGMTSDELLTMIDRIGGECLALLDGVGDDTDWSELRDRGRGDGAPQNSAAFFLLHALDHLRGHADEASLTRHMWMQQH